MVPSDCRMFIWNYLLCMLFLWMEQGGIFCTFPSPSISKSFILYIDIWRTVSTVPSYPHPFSLLNLPPPNILTSSSFSVDIGRRVSMPSTYHPLLRFLSSFGGSFGERVQQILLFSNNPSPFPYSLHIHQTSTFFPMTGREVQNASCE